MAVVKTDMKTSFSSWLNWGVEFMNSCISFMYSLETWVVSSKSSFFLESISFNKYGDMYSTRSFSDKLKPGMLIILEIEGKSDSLRDSYVGSTSLKTAYASIDIVTVLLLAISVWMILFHKDSSSSMGELTERKCFLRLLWVGSRTIFSKGSE